jgi:L-alanine-DL-glutamate epimerase-like enolase superfamily enzyme
MPKPDKCSPLGEDLRIDRIEKIPVVYHATKKGWKKGPKRYEAWPSEIPAIIVKVHASNGLCGIGEAVTQHWYYGSTMADMYKAISMYERELKGEDPRNLERIEKILEGILARGVPRVQPARDGLNMAIYDLLGKQYDEPIYNLLGGARQTEFTLQTNLYMETPEEMASESRRYVKKGFAGLKVKCGLDLETKGWSLQTAKQEVRKLTAALDSVPDTVNIDADSNQAWGTARRAITLVKSFGLERYPNLAIEQPNGLNDLEGARRISEGISLPLVLDEAVYSPEILSEIVRRNAADRIVLKSQRVGGLYVARKMITLAEAAGIDISLESGLGMIGDTAVCHLAATVKVPYPLEAETHSWIRENPVKKGGIAIEGGLAKVGGSPGLGIELDDEVIDRIRVKNIASILS